MYKRLGVPPKLVPVWVQQQYVKDGAIEWKQLREGNTVWILTHTSMVDPGSPPPPDYMLSDPQYIQLLR